MELDTLRVRPRGGRTPLPMPPEIPWPAFREWFAERWKVGQHVAIVGMTGSGKTTLARSILEIRDFVVVMGTKRRDSSLYKPLQARGFARLDTWDPWQWEDTAQRHVIFAPPLLISQDGERSVDSAQEEQARDFRIALLETFEAGAWCVYADEIAYLTDPLGRSGGGLGLTGEVNLLYLQGRSEGVTMVSSTQRPRSVPLNVFMQADWFFLWRISDREDRQRAAEFTGPLQPVVFEAIARLPRYEFVCVHAPEDEIVRSKVRL